MVIVRREGPPLIPDEPDPTVDTRRRGDRRGQICPDLRVKRRELQCGWIAAGIVAVHRPSLVDDLPEHSRERVASLEPVCRVDRTDRVRSTGEEALHRSIV